MNKGKKGLTQNFLSLGIVQIANYVLPLLSIPVISRIIGPDKFGVINFAAAFVAYFNLLISYGFDLTATRRIAKDPENASNRNTVFSEVFHTQCLLFILSTLLFTIILFTVPQLKAERTVIIFSFLICIGTLFTQNWLFQAMQNLSKVALFNLISKLLFTIIILLVVRKKEDYTWQPLLYSSIQIFVALLSFRWALKKYNITFVKVSLESCLKLLYQERIIFFSIVVGSLYTTTNTFILGLYKSSEQVGYYTAGQRLIFVIQSVLTIPLGQALYPYIGKSFGESREKGLQVAQKLIPLLIAFTVTAAISMYFLGPYILNLFYGNKFNSAIIVLKILVFIPTLMCLSNVFGIQIMMNLNLDKTLFKITICAAILSISLNLLIVQSLGYIGTAINWLVTETFITVSMYIALRRKGINPINFSYFRPIVLSSYLMPIKRRLLAGTKRWHLSA